MAARALPPLMRFWPARGPDETGDVLDDELANGNGVDELLQVDDGPGGENLFDFDFFIPRRRHQNPLLLRSRRIADFDVEHEAVELSFGKRIGSFLLDGVLRGNDEEGLGQLHCLPPDGDFPFLHRLQQGGLGLGRCPVDFVRQQDVGKDGAFDEAETSLPLFVFFQHVGSGDVRGHQVGSELNPFEGDIQNPGQGADHQRLGEPRHPFEQAMPSGENGREKLLDDFVLAHDDALQFLLHDQAMLGELLENLGNNRCLRGRSVEVE